jgi:hypothetical protein
MMNESAASQPVDEFCARVTAAQAKLDGAWTQHYGLNGQLERLKKSIACKSHAARLTTGSMKKRLIESDLDCLDKQRRVLNDQIAGCEGRIAAAEIELAEAKRARDARWQTAVALIMIFRDWIRQAHKVSLKARDLEREKSARAERKAAHKAQLKAAKEARRRKKAAEAASLEADRAARAAQIAAQQKAAQAKANRKRQHG